MWRRPAVGAARRVATRSAASLRLASLRLATRWLAARQRVAGWLRLARLVPQAGWPMVALAAALALLAGLLPAAFILAMADVLGTLQSGAGAASGTPAAGALAAAGSGLVLAVLAFCGQQLVAPVQVSVAELMARRVDGAALNDLMRTALAAPLPRVERESALTALTDASAAFLHTGLTPGPGAAALFPLAARYLQLAAALALVAGQLSGPVAVLVGAAALLIRYGQRGSLGRFARLWDELDGDRRRLLYLRALGVESAAAKEMRSLRLVGWLTGRHQAESQQHLRRLWAGRRAIYLRPFLGYSTFGLLVGLVAFATIALTPAYRTDALGLAVAIQALLVPLRFGVNFPECDVPTQFGLQSHQAHLAYRAEVGAPPTGPVTAQSTVDNPVPVAGEPAAAGEPPAVVFEGVWFGYPGAARPVLDGLDLPIPAGRSTAIVGANGAGKTTLVKLLAGFYRPDRGRITVDGHDLAGVDPAGWQARLAVILQDFIRYEASLRENVAFGGVAAGLAGGVRDAAVLAALDRAGAGDLPASLPCGLSTVLAPEYAGGVGLSGGQWQRVALARALYAVRCGASVLVLDEPTAQLDVRSEYAFFDRFLALTAGLTTVVISHRFSSVRRADQIVVLAAGRIVEQGTHEQLLARGGEYARMFRLQAKQFADPAAGR
jgi:ATP-binding cassette subfamily B protein